MSKGCKGKMQTMPRLSCDLIYKMLVFIFYLQLISHLRHGYLMVIYRSSPLSIQFQSLPRIFFLRFLRIQFHAHTQILRELQPCFSLKGSLNLQRWMLENPKFNATHFKLLKYSLIPQLTFVSRFKRTLNPKSARNQSVCLYQAYYICSCKFSQINPVCHIFSMLQIMSLSLIIRYNPSNRPIDIKW